MTDDDTYLVWSNEHRGWWRDGARGYCSGLLLAGLYSRAGAIEICRRALPTAAHIGVISEIPVRLADLQETLRDQIVPKAVYAGRGTQVE